MRGCSRSRIWEIFAGIASSSAVWAAASAAETVPRMRPTCSPSRYSAVIWATNALVDATAMGHDVDQPRNLAKSVTVE